PSGGIAGGSGAAPGGGGSAAVDLTPGQLSKDEIRTSVREVLPLLVDCYTLMLDKHPTIGGRVLAKLVVEAEPDLGTIVTMQDDSEVDMNAATDAPAAMRSDLADFHQCLGATLETIVLPPLGDKDGGRVEITYPFVFAPSEEDAEKYEKPAPPPAPRQKRAPPPDAPATSGKTADELLADSESKARLGQWPPALALAEQAMRAGDASTKTRARAAMVASLAACNLKDARKARRYYPQATPSARTLIRVRCDSNGVSLPLPDEGELKNPFQ
ncbi:MAG: hypothetical protein K8M05_25475, partial [Deltaproteobacteria bacterium]|nr:hypothetical protein [Kofleriaceae bacterium]